MSKLEKNATGGAVAESDFRPFTRDGAEADSGGFDAIFGDERDAIPGDDAETEDADPITEFPNYRGRHRLEVECEEWLRTTESREEIKDHFFNTILLENSGDQEKGQALGNSVIRELGDPVLPEGEESGEPEDDACFGTLPTILANYSVSHSSRNNLDPITATASALTGLSSALGRGVFITSKERKVHPNLLVVNMTNSGGGKTDFHSPVEIVCDELDEIERQSSFEAETSKRRLKAIEKKIDAGYASVDSGEGNSNQMAEWKKVAQRLKPLSNHRVLSFREDMTPQALARAISIDGQGGAAVLSTAEGSTFFSRFAPVSKNDSGYSSLLTAGYNDTRYGMNRVDEGRMTNDKCKYPRLCVTVSIQIALVGEAVQKISQRVGVFQRALFAIQDKRKKLRKGASLFSKDRVADPAKAAFKTMLQSITRKCWEEPGREVELLLSKDASNQLDAYWHANDALVIELESSDQILSEYVGRGIEQVLKIVQCLHVASCADPQSGIVDWVKVAKPISGKSVERAIALHDIWKLQTLEFVNRWMRPVKTGIEGLTCEKVKQAMRKALDKAKDPESGLQNGDILKYLPGFSSDDFRRVVDENPEAFKVITAGNRGMKLYFPNQNAADFGFNIRNEGGLDAA